MYYWYREYKVSVSFFDDLIVQLNSSTIRAKAADGKYYLWGGIEQLGAEVCVLSQDKSGCQ